MNLNVINTSSLKKIDKKKKRKKEKKRTQKKKCYDLAYATFHGICKHAYVMIATAGQPSLSSMNLGKKKASYANICTPIEMPPSVYV